jgi:hypothetical protein
MKRKEIIKSNISNIFLRKYSVVELALNGEKIAYAIKQIIKIYTSNPYNQYCNTGLSIMAHVVTK